MPRPPDPNPLDEFRRVLFMVAVLALAVLAAVWTIDTSPAHVYASNPDPSPYGYTFSLALFVFPLATLWRWLVKSGFVKHLHAVRLTVAVLFPLWSLLDIFLANVFFVFPVKSATIQALRVWGWVPGHGFERTIPIEEFVFYLGGALLLLLLYIWSSEVWYARYSMPRDVFNQRARHAPPLVAIHARTIAGGVALFGLALLYKYSSPDAPAGFPGYLLFLMALVVLPAAALYRRVAVFINGRAFLFTVMATTLVSLLWEVTLALPYGWWDYQRQHMLGIFVRPWSNLPLEASVLWIAAGWAGVFIYETFRIYTHSGKDLRTVLFGPRGAAA